VGGTLQFTTEDSETHNVHLLMEGATFNQGVSPGGAVSFVPKAPGVVRVVCDVHSHMRAFVVVAASPWVAVCSPEGRFRLDGVPDGSYVLKVWHELEDGTWPGCDVEVEGGRDVALPPIAVGGEAAGRRVLTPAPVRKWPDIIDRIGMLLAGSLQTAAQPGGRPRALRLAEDAYWVEFEASGMEVAIRRHLGFERAGELEEQFYAFTSLIRGAGGSPPSASRGTEATRKLLLALSRTAEDLNRLGIVDASHMSSGRAVQPSSSAAPGGGDHRGLMRALEQSFAGVRVLADRGEPDEASSALSVAYFSAFEPLERILMIRSPGAVSSLEARFNALRGEIRAGLKGPALGAQLDEIRSRAEAALGRAEAVPSGSFGASLVASLVIILREGVEIILVLSMLVALVAKTGQPRAMAAIGWGVGLAVAASLATALGLNRLVSATQGQTRELLEGGVMLAAAGVLFYVSFWLISQSESKRWTDFLKRHARQGTAPGGLGTLGLTAFLAIYREGAELALMYQGLIADQKGAHGGLLGVGIGLAVGLVLLAGIVVAVRWASVRVPLRPFFQVSGGLLFALAVIFAGKGVSEWQTAGLIKVSGLPWLGPGVPVLGLFPNVQVASVQGLMLAGAVLATLVVALGRSAPTPGNSPETSRVGTPVEEMTRA
jgi:high-affinity iron transporter